MALEVTPSLKLFDLTNFGYLRFTISILGAKLFKKDQQGIPVVCVECAEAYHDFALLAQLDRALVSGTKGCRFDSCAGYQLRFTNFTL